MKYFDKGDNSAGFTLIESLVGTALVVLVFGGLFLALQGSLRLLSQSKILVTAQALATEKMELIKNLPYDDVGTVLGIPSGLLPQEEIVVRNNVTYNVRIKIVYIDDVFDDVAPIDTLATDYKKVRVEVIPINSSIGQNNPVVLISNIAPKGVESTAGGGTISLLVFDSAGQPVPSAEVTIQKNNEAPFVDIVTYTDSYGRVVLPGAPVCTECYFVSATKPGHNTDRTYSTVEVANPDKPYLSVLEGKLSEQSFGIDLFSSLVISSFGQKSAGFPVLPGVSFRAHSTRIIGTDTLDNPVYDFDQNLSTDGGGNLVITNLTWGNYNLSLENVSSLDLAGTSPQLNAVVPAGQSVSLYFSVAPASTHSLLVKVKDNSAPLAGAQIRLFNIGLGYDETKFSGNLSDPDTGQAFFPALSSGAYDLEVGLSGYLSASSSVQIENWTSEEVILSPE